MESRSRFASEVKIIVVRHGRSSLVHRGWLDLAAFRRWRSEYEAAGIAVNEKPPQPLVDAAATAGLIIASDSPRAIESARLLAPGHAITTSPLLRELTLEPPPLRIRLPLAGWALAFGVHWLMGARHPPADVARASDAAAWLVDLAAQHKTILAVTHATFRGLVAELLIKDGWRPAEPDRRSAHWSAWSFQR